MSRFHSYLNSTVHILSEYDGKSPFSLYLKKFFSRYKKFGSRDRSLISDYCYQYFRIGKAFSSHSMEERILIGRFLCSTGKNQMLEVHKPKWNELASSTLEEKLTYLGADMTHVFENLFQWKDELSPEIDFSQFAASYVVQPDVFLRIRPGKEEIVRLKLKGHHIPFTKISESTVALEANSKVDQVLSIDKEAVVQDLSSQRVGIFFSEILNQKEVKVWDCCAASGGKSIMAYDINPDIKLTASDVRKSILYNLDNRFESAGIEHYKSIQLDLSKPQTVPDSPFDVIIADVPCSGSGTWGRTPEQLVYFEDAKIDDYATLQRTIISNAVPHLKDEGYVVYITCSVFKKENEDNVEYLVNNLGLEQVNHKVIKGYHQKADSMFVSVLKKDVS